MTTDARCRRTGAAPDAAAADAAASADDDRGDRAAPGHALAAAAEDAGRRRSERHQPRREAAAAVLGARRAHPARARREAHRGPRRDRRRHRRLPLHPDRPRPRSRQAVLRRLPLRRSGAGAARAVQRLRPRVHGGAARTSIATCCPPASSISIVNKAMFDQLGPAVNSGKSLFLYGAPGNGKTVLAEGIGRALGTEMYVPHAIDVDGQIITMFDPVNHQPIASKARRGARASSPARRTIAGGRRSGGRWSSSAAS